MTLPRMVALVQPSVVIRMSTDMNKAPPWPQKLRTASTAAIWTRASCTASSAGMGSSAMGASTFRKKLQQAGREDVTVVHAAIESIPHDTDVVVAFHGAMRIGAVWVGVHRNLAAPEKA